MSDSDEELTRLLREHATRHAAPDRLRASIRTQVALADAARGRDPKADGRRRWFGFGPATAAARWGAPTAAFALGMLCMALVLPLVQRAGWGEPIENELVLDHVQALRSNALVQVVSTDRHTVKPWFQGRIDYAPPVFDFAGEGFLLTGGRIEQVRGRSVATLVYARNKHTVDVFIQPSAAHEAPSRSVHRGFNVVSWADGSMQYWIVSDMDREETDTFAKLWTARSASN